jgi:mercuric ion transport protein
MVRTLDFLIEQVHPVYGHVQSKRFAARRRVGRRRRVGVLRRSARALTLGIGGAWIANLTALEPLRPWFIAATLLFLGLAFRRLYLQPQVCEPGAACAEPIVLRRQRLIFWLVALALLALLSVPWLAPFFL